MKEIQLTRGQVALVDDEDFEGLNQWNWFAYKDSKNFYAIRHLFRYKGKRIMLRMHHEIIGKPPKGLEVDHRNGRGTDNQRKNLRFVTHRQNTQNRKNQKSSSRYPGVCRIERRKKWSAQIRINGKDKWLGYFIDEYDAFEAYKQAVENLGEKVIEDY